MCSLLGTEPIDSEIPIEFEDLPDEVQNTLLLYNMLQDNYDTMNGYYLGKNLAGIDDIFNISEVDDKKTTFRIIQMLDSIRMKIVNDKRPTKS